MSAAVAIMPTRATVEATWGAYQRLAQQLVDDSRLVVDRAFMERLARAEADWRAAFLAWEGR